MAASFLLDTSLLVGLARSSEWALRTVDEFKLNDRHVFTCTSVICRGEMLALAEKFGWGAGKRDVLEGILARLPTVELNNPSILQAYALIDAWTHGSTVAAPNQTPPPKPAKRMGQNDLWIAATAHASEFTLLSADRDFEHLQGSWLDFVCVDQGMG